MEITSFCVFVPRLPRNRPRVSGRIPFRGMRAPHGPDATSLSSTCRGLRYSSPAPPPEPLAWFRALAALLRRTWRYAGHRQRATPRHRRPSAARRWPEPARHRRRVPRASVELWPWAVPCGTHPPTKPSGAGLPAPFHPAHGPTKTIRSRLWPLRRAAAGL